MKSIPTFIFDLDGVITNTEKYHFQSWREICKLLKFNLTSELNEELKGISRDKCLKKILDWAKLEISVNKFNELLDKSISVQD